jgi:phosphohistidine phosphatase
MSKILYIIRHAQAANGLNQTDAERVLTPVGEQQANNVGKLLKSNGIFPDVILSSPAVRAHKTSSLIATQLEIDPSSIKINRTIYSGSLIEILKVINELDLAVRTALVVGHFPTIVELYSYLTNKDQIASMDTAEIRSLIFEVSWSEVSENSGTPIGI